MAVHAKFLLRSNLVRKISYLLGRSRADYVVKFIEPYLEGSDQILDIGAGSCIIDEVLGEKKFTVTPLDVENVSLVGDMKPILYDGRRLPFSNNAFDVSLLISTLHHTLKPERIVEEAMRVSQRLIIVEDIFASPIEKYLTYFIDSVQNQEFRGHPHTNKTDAGWKLLFEQLGLTLIDSRYTRWFYVIQHAFYYLEK